MTDAAPAPAEDELVPFRQLAALAENDPARRELRDELVRGHLDVARNLARKFDRRGEPLDDLVQVATVGLIKSVDRFDPEHGSGFLAFAVPTIMGELRRHFRDTAWAVRVPRRLKELTGTVANARSELSQRLGRAPRPSELADFLGISREDVREVLVAGSGQTGASLDRLLEESPGTQFGAEDPELEEVDNREALGPMLAALPELERTIVVLRFFRSMSQAAIGERVGVSQMQVSRVLARTLRRLRNQLDQAEPGQ